MRVLFYMLLCLNLCMANSYGAVKTVEKKATHISSEQDGKLYVHSFKFRIPQNAVSFLITAYYKSPIELFF